MEYKVFISHSVRDQSLVISLANLLTKFKVKVVVAEWYLTPGMSLDKKVINLIKKSDCMVVLLTKNGIRSNWVQQEVGIAISAGKPIIPIVEKGTDSKNLAALQGKEYIEYNPFQPEEAIIKLASFIKSLKLKKEEEEKSRLVIGVIILLFILLLLSGEK